MISDVHINSRHGHRLTSFSRNTMYTLYVFKKYTFNIMPCIYLIINEVVNKDSHATRTTSKHELIYILASNNRRSVVL